jgi:hypothetical protein
MAEFPAPDEGILLTHFIVSDDVERSRRFYTEVLERLMPRRARALVRGMVVPRSAAGDEGRDAVRLRPAWRPSRLQTDSCRRRRRGTRGVDQSTRIC